MSYQPPGGIAAPEYGRPPRKNRAGLVIVLLVLLLIAVLGTAVWVASKLITDLKPTAEPTPAPAPVTSVVPKPSATKPIPVKTVPVKPVPITQPPALPAGTPAELAGRLVARLNANDPAGAGKLACTGLGQVIPSLMEAQLKPPTKLVVGEVVGQGPVYAVRMSGTTKGRSVSGLIVIRKVDQNMCVQAFSVTPG